MADLLGRPLERVIGSSLRNCLPAADRLSFSGALDINTGRVVIAALERVNRVASLR